MSKSLRVWFGLLVLTQLFININASAFFWGWGWFRRYRSYEPLQMRSGSYFGRPRPYYPNRSIFDAPQYPQDTQKANPSSHDGTTPVRRPISDQTRTNSTPPALPEGITLDTPLQTLLDRKDIRFVITTKRAIPQQCVFGSVGTEFNYQNGRLQGVNVSVDGNYPLGTSCEVKMNELFSGTTGPIHKFGCNLSSSVSTEFVLDRLGFAGKGGFSLRNKNYAPETPDGRDRLLSNVLAKREPKEHITFRRVECRDGTPPRDRKMTLRDFIQNLGPLMDLQITSG